MGFVSVHYKAFIFLCADLWDVRHHAKRIYFNLCFQHNHALLNMPFTGGGSWQHWTQVSSKATTTLLCFQFKLHTISLLLGILGTLNWHFGKTAHLVSVWRLLGCILVRWMDDADTDDGFLNGSYQLLLLRKQTADPGALISVINSEWITNHSHRRPCHVYSEAEPKTSSSTLLSFVWRCLVNIFSLRFALYF